MFLFTFIGVGNKELPLEQLLRGSVSLGNSSSWRRFKEQAPGPHKETKKLVFQLQLFRAKMLVSERVILKNWTIVTSIANANETVIYILKQYFTKGIQSLMLVNIVQTNPGYNIKLETSQTSCGNFLIPTLQSLHPGLGSHFFTFFAGQEALPFHKLTWHWKNNTILNRKLHVPNGPLSIFFVESDVFVYTCISPKCNYQ